MFLHTFSLDPLSYGKFSLKLLLQNVIIFFIHIIVAYYNTQKVNYTSLFLFSQ